MRKLRSPARRSAALSTTGTFTRPNEIWPFQIGRDILGAPESARVVATPTLCRLAFDDLARDLRNNYAADSTASNRSAELAWPSGCFGISYGGESGQVSVRRVLATAAEPA